MKKKAPCAMERMLNPDPAARERAAAAIADVFWHEIEEGKRRRAAVAEILDSAIPEASRGKQLRD